MKRDPAIVSKTMKRICSRDTGIEMKLRRALKEKGLSYRVCSSLVPGHPDILFPRLRIAIFADSEFWHGYHFDENKSRLTTNPDFWVKKIERNIARDKEVNGLLADQGYLVLRFWGQEIEKDLDRVVQTILIHVEARKRILELKEQIHVYTTLCYIQKGDSYLFLRRNKKPNDVNEGKCIGVGGHLEEGETPAQCLKREILEETGLTVKKYVYVGKIDFLNSACDPERMYLYRVTEVEGELRECDEGELFYCPKGQMMDLPLWEGDKIFLPLLESPSPFGLDLLYDHDDLIEVRGPYPLSKKKDAKKGKRK